MTTIRARIQNAKLKDASIVDYKTSRMVANSVAGSFMAIHIAMFIVFAVNGVKPMAIFNIFSIAFYGLCFYINYKAKFKEFVLYSLIEVLLHMTAAVYFTGWENGFQITLIGITQMLIISEYLGRMMDVERLPSFALCGVIMLTYIAEYIIGFYHTTPYPLPEKVTFWLNIAWAVITFVISVGSMISFVWLITSTETMLTQRAAKDRLTGLNNRTGIMQSLEELSGKHGLSGCWAAMMDIDDFKLVNDTYGHLCGDYVLREIASLMQRDNVDAVLSRWGGEEFLIIGFTDGDMEIHLARLEQLRKSIEEHDFTYEDTHLKITVTIGVAEYAPEESIDEWIDRADRNLYEGKRSGKNKVVS